MELTEYTEIFRRISGFSVYFAGSVSKSPRRESRGRRYYCPTPTYTPGPGRRILPSNVAQCRRVARRPGRRWRDLFSDDAGGFFRAASAADGRSLAFLRGRSRRAPPARPRAPRRNFDRDGIGSFGRTYAATAGTRRRLARCTVGSEWVSRLVAHGHNDVPGLDHGRFRTWQSGRSSARIWGAQRIDCSPDAMIFDSCPAASQRRD